MCVYNSDAFRKHNPIRGHQNRCYLTLTICVTLKFILFSFPCEERHWGLSLQKVMQSVRHKLWSFPRTCHYLIYSSTTLSQLFLCSRALAHYSQLHISRNSPIHSRQKVTRDESVHKTETPPLRPRKLGVRGSRCYVTRALLPIG